MFAVIEAIQAVKKAQKRITEESRPGVTYFSGKDVWLYEMWETATTCQNCKSYEDQASAMGGFNGNFIRSLFPYLMILDENTIGGQAPNGDGLAHPNCRCRLRRFVGDPSESIIAQKRLVDRENKKR